MAHITVREACNRIGVTDSVIYTSKKYRPYLHKTGTRSIENRFDIEGYLRQRDIEEELVEKTKLFVEYLIHIEHIKVKEIAQMAGCSENLIYAHQFGYDIALRIVTAFDRDRRGLVDRFDGYYGFRMGSIA